MSQKKTAFQGETSQQ